MDNHQMKVDSYGRLIHVPEYPKGYSDPNFQQPSAPEPMVAQEAWARTERVKRLEDTVIMLTDRVNQCDIRIRVLETSPLQKMPEESKSIGNIAEPPRERICDSCKWGTPDTFRDIDCHYEPQDVSHTPSWWCSRWTEK
jgi:hypothetical protein